MQNRSELSSIYFQFAKMITIQFSSKIKILCTNNAMNIKNLLLPSSYLIIEQLFKDLVLELRLKMGTQKENTYIF